MLPPTETNGVAVPGNRRLFLWCGVSEQTDHWHFFKGVGNMSTLTHLSDEELDTVTGGFALVFVNKQVNLAEVQQSAANVALIAFKGGQNISQGVSISQG
jgi:hypothetical protein